jgi:molecular chaperone DnaK
MDANGILSVSARDLLSGREQAVRITPSTGLGKDEIDRMVAEARESWEKDRESRELTELRNRIQARAAVLVRSYLALGSLLDAADQKMINEALRRASELGPEDGDAETLGELLALVEAGASRLSEAVMSSPGEGKGGDPGGTEKPEAGMRNLMKAALDDMEHT